MATLFHVWLEDCVAINHSVNKGCCCYSRLWRMKLFPIHKFALSIYLFLCYLQYMRHAKQHLLYCALCTMQTHTHRERENYVFLSYFRYYAFHYFLCFFVVCCWFLCGTFWAFHLNCKSYLNVITIVVEVELIDDQSSVKKRVLRYAFEWMANIYFAFLYWKLKWIDFQQIKPQRIRVNAN